MKSSSSNTSIISFSKRGDCFFSTSNTFAKSSASDRKIRSYFWRFERGFQAS